MKNFANVLKASASASILAIIAGLPVDANGFFLSEEQMTAIDDSLATAEAATAALAGVQEQLTTANASLETSNGQLVTAQADLSTANTALATAQARVTELEALSGQSAKTGKGADAFDKTADMKQYETSYDRMFQNV